MKREFIVERDGKSFVLYAGLLDEAHQQGLQAITTELLQVPNVENGYVAICRATVVTGKGAFTGIGDASPDNVTRLMRAHIIRMAETRAKARALRDAVNVGTAALEELGEDVIGEDGVPDYAAYHREERPAPPRPVGAAPQKGAAAGAGGELASPAQINAIRTIAARTYHWSEEDVDAHCQERYGRPVPQLGKREASEFIDALKAGAVA